VFYHFSGALAKLQGSLRSRPQKRGDFGPMRSEKIRIKKATPQQNVEENSDLQSKTNPLPSWKLTRPIQRQLRRCVSFPIGGI